ncbi:sugar phosphate isomerase/epimerase [Mucilaginibacter yixingensis]|uniref:Sugar phosphate isomerase/epimerase n=1 Tax=Mucilaginibacter yixingensis TaxID=1295612 RepID=A0A2T5JBF7_9SPHI|nr:sugar phosphate isomerase/epimerase [Mucilaginibacter yixingensis]PTQ98192.1 sugar phosphate isomerase/epimerase [Mucilaginibacter yixingensis]
MQKQKSKALLIAGLSLLSGAWATRAQAQQKDQLFPQAPGIVSYTYRNQFAKDVPATLDMIKGNGITDIEFSSLFKQTPEHLRQLLDERGLHCSSYGVSYEDLTTKTDEVAAAAKALGAQYVRVAGIPHTKGNFTLENAKQAVADFNKAGKILKDKYGLNFIYHNHGFEFVPYPEQVGTYFDYIIRNTDFKYVNFELDILWAFFPGQDPAKLLNTFGERFKALHLKDLKKGVAGNNSGGTDQNNDVVLGTGQINIPAVLKAARNAGVEHYYIEDESSASAEQVPQSIKYLNSLKK